MPRKTVPRKTNTAKKTRTKKTDQKTDQKMETQPPVSDVEVAVEVKTPVVKKRSPTKQYVMDSFEQLLSSVSEEITRLRELKVKGNPGVKFLRSLTKQVKTMRSLVDKSIKTKRPSTRKPNTTSGFLKPVALSEELCNFTGWDSSELKSRVDVTKYICNYIKEHELQNPDDRREIQVDKDAKLKKLLKYNSKTADKPLTYYSLQTYMKPHFSTAKAK